MVVVEERDLRRSLVEACRPDVARLAKQLAPTHADVATQVGLIGVLESLARVRRDGQLAKLGGEDLGRSEVFRRLALDEASREIKAWIDRGASWRRRR
jgi:hypothetical protein